MGQRLCKLNNLSILENNKNIEKEEFIWFEYKEIPCWAEKVSELPHTQQSLQSPGGVWGSHWENRRFSKEKNIKTYQGKFRW